MNIGVRCYLYLAIPDMNNLRDFFHQRRVPFSKAAPSLRFRLDGATIIRSFCCRRHFSLFFSFSLPCSIFFFPLPYSFFWPVEASAFYRDRETIFPPTGTTDRFRASFKRYHGEFDEYWMANGEWSTPCRFGIFFFFYLSSSTIFFLLPSFSKNAS